MRTYIIKHILPLLTLVFTLATNGYAQSIESTHTVKPGGNSLCHFEDVRSYNKQH